MGREWTKPFAQSVRWKNGAWRYRVLRWVIEEQRKTIFNGKQEVTLSKKQSDALLKYHEITKLLNLVKEGLNEDGLVMGDLISSYMSKLFASYSS